MGATPPIPAWIKNYRAPGYTNIWELLPAEKKLYGTETLFGDWGGELLILLPQPRTGSKASLGGRIWNTEFP